MAARMGGNEVRHDTGMKPGFTRYLVEFFPQPAEQTERRLAHIIKDIVLGMLRGDFQTARSMVENQFLQIWI